MSPPEVWRGVLLDFEMKEMVVWNVSKSYAFDFDADAGLQACFHVIHQLDWTMIRERVYGRGGEAKPPHISMSSKTSGKSLSRCACVYIDLRDPRKECANERGMHWISAKLQSSNAFSFSNPWRCCLSVPSIQRLFVHTPLTPVYGAAPLLSHIMPCHCRSPQQAL